MAIAQKIRDKKLQFDVNIKAAKTSALSSRQTEKYEFLMGEGTQPADQNRVIKQANFPHSLLVKIF